MDNLEALLTEDETSTTRYRELIETVISSLEQDNSAMVNHLGEGTIWKFQYGSVEVFVQLTGETNTDLLTVWSPVLTLPVAAETELLRKLMNFNWSGTFETCFAILNSDSNAQVVVSCQRTLEDLSASEISRIITLVATIADDNDDPLQAEFPTIASQS